MLELAMAEALVDLDRLGRNIKIVRRRLGGRARLLFTVKADAYGHGALPVAQEAARAGVDWLGAASAAEALRLREGGIDLPILVLGLSHRHHLPLLAELGELRIALTVDNLEFAEALDRAAARRGTRLPIHVKLDTGLGRIGLPAEEAPPFFWELHRLRSL
ncbi:MAG: alanine racemase, partial [Candidatus Bipolaricaulia bacterium]